MSLKENYHKVKTKLIDLFGRIYFQDVASLVLMGICALIFLSLLLILVFRIKATDNLVPLFYNSTYGVTSSVMWYNLYFLPLAYFLIMVINTLIAWAFFEKERLITYLVLLATIISGILLLIAEYNLTILIRG